MQENQGQSSQRQRASQLQWQQYLQKYKLEQENEEMERLGTTSKKVKREDPYRHIFDRNQARMQEYNQGRLYFKWKVPYPIQISYMNFLLTGLDAKTDCLIQAPTGSGKTLCLLNSIFGWLVNSKETEHRKVIYTSRSHSQLQQLKKQLSQTCYRPNTVVFGGRKKMCCNQKINKHQNEDQNFNQCSKAVKYSRLHKKIKSMSEETKLKKNITKQYEEEVEKNMCQYFQDYQQRSSKASLVYKKLQGLPISWEDEYTSCVNMKTCPYYYAPTVKYFPDLIIMPYNYVLNRRILTRFQKVISGSILVFDEGHNVLEFARSGMTTSIKLSEIQSIIDLLKTCQNKIYKKFDDFPLVNDQNDAEDEQQIQGNKKLQQKKDKPKRQLQMQQKQDDQTENKEKKNMKENKQKQQEMKKLKKKELQKKLLGNIQLCRNIILQIFNNFKKFEQENIEVYKNQDKICIPRGENDINIIKTFIQVFFGHEASKKELTRLTIQEHTKHFKFIADILCKICQDISQLSNKQYIPFNLTKFASTLRQFAEIIQDKWTLFNYGMFFQWIKVHKQDKKFQYHLEVKLYCYSPKLMFDLLKNLPMSMIITSGTLVPMDTWEIQTGIKFSIMPPNSQHVIKPIQCLTVFMPQYKGQNAYYTTGEDQKFVPFNAKRAMQAIKQICKSTPGGVLVIVPSKTWISQIKKIFPKSQITKKPFYQEKSEELMKSLQKFTKVYSQACENLTGAVLFAKCRGQLTEGIDLKDQMCRAVVIVGYPYPNMADPYLQGKLNFFDRCKLVGISSINGKQWMKKQIIRAVNQGIGRVIRNKDDYGMVFLLDVRYKWTDIKNDLPQWALRKQTTIKDHRQIENVCKMFFDTQRQRIADQRL